MQAQRHLTYLFCQIFAALQTRCAQMALLGSVLLLVALMIFCEVHLVGTAHTIHAVARQIVEGSPDIAVSPTHVV